MIEALTIDQARELPMVPVLVADRLNHLQILAGLPLAAYPHATVGIMANAHVSRSFQDAYRDYPCMSERHCEAIGGSCPCWQDRVGCQVRQAILARTIKLCDSGAFKCDAVPLSYDQLFRLYARMGVAYGIMMDVLGDPRATLASAEQALEAYEPYRGTFVLVGVAQGTSLEDYLQSYRDLKALGLTHIAVGGLLRKRAASARFVQVGDERFMFAVMAALREEHPRDWLFALGAFHPKRMARLRELRVWADYKGWLFGYKSRQQALNELIDDFSRRHLDALSGAFTGKPRPDRAKLFSSD